MLSFVALMAKRIEKILQKIYFWTQNWKQGLNTLNFKMKLKYLKYKPIYLGFNLFT